MKKVFRKSENSGAKKSDSADFRIKKGRVLAARDYREWLKNLLNEKKKTNDSYSLRAFARDLGFAPSRISQIIQGKQGLSLAAAQKICQKLKLEEDEAIYFCLLVESQDSRSKQKRALATEKLKSLRIKTKEQNYVQLSEQEFSPISEWYYFAILELLALPNAVSDSTWIAQKLGLSVLEASLAVDRLKQNQFLKELRGKWTVNVSRLSTAYNVPSLTVRKFNNQILTKASDALETQNVLERDISSLILKMNSSEIPRFKKMLNDFRREFDNEVSSSIEKNPNSADSVYALSISLFKLSDVNSHQED